MLQPAGRQGPLWILLKIAPPPTPFLPSPAVSSFPFPASHTWRRKRQAEDFVTNCYGFCDVKRRAQSFKFGPTSSHYKVKQCKEVKSEAIIRGVLSACCWCLLHPPSHLPSRVDLLLSFKRRDSRLHFWVLWPPLIEFQNVTHIKYSDKVEEGVEGSMWATGIWSAWSLTKSFSYIYILKDNL